jgi:hypothetical protein
MPKHPDVKKQNNINVLLQKADGHDYEWGTMDRPTEGRSTAISYLSREGSLLGRFTVEVRFSAHEDFGNPVLISVMQYLY